MAYYDLKKSGAQFMFNLRGGNNEVMLTSERYVAKVGAQTGIAAVKAHSPFDTNYRRKTSIGGAAYFTLVAANGETIGTSEMYSSTYARDQGIEAVKREAPGAPTRDNT